MWAADGGRIVYHLPKRTRELGLPLPALQRQRLEVAWLLDSLGYRARLCLKRGGGGVRAEGWQGFLATASFLVLLVPQSWMDRPMLIVTGCTSGEKSLRMGISLPFAYHRSFSGGGHWLGVYPTPHPMHVDS